MTAETRDITIEAMTENSKTILIVDDSESIRELVEHTLLSMGYAVLKGKDGEDAMNYFDGQAIHLVITDLNMPQLDGIGLIKRIRATEQYRMVPVLVLTTEALVSKKEEARTAGATGWIVKPVSKEKLVSVVKKVIR